MSTVVQILCYNLSNVSGILMLKLRKFTDKSNFSHVSVSAQKRLGGAQMHPGRRVDSFGGEFSVMQLGKFKSIFGFYDI